MKKFTLVVIVVLVAFFANQAAAQWLPMNSPTEQYINTALTVDDFIFIFDYEATFRTDDSGNTWEQLAVESVLCAKYINNKIFVVGIDGMAKVSDDMGDTWEDIPILSGDNDLIDIVEVNGNIAFIPYKAYCATVMDLSNNEIDTLSLPYAFNDPYYAELSFSYENRLFLVAGEHLKSTMGPCKGLYYTDDLGQTWNEVASFAEQVVGSISSSYIRNDNVYMSVNSNSSLKPRVIISYDGGMNWSTYFQIEEYSHAISSIYINSDDELFAAGAHWENNQMMGFILENQLVNNISNDAALDFIIGNDSQLVAVGNLGKIYTRGMVSIATNHIEASNILAYPNPCFDRLNVKFDNDLSNETSVYVYDITGKLIKKLQINSDFSLDFSSQPTGIYFVNIDGVTIKIVKK